MFTNLLLGVPESELALSADPKVIEAAGSEAKTLYQLCAVTDTRQRIKLASPVVSSQCPGPAAQERFRELAERSGCVGCRIEVVELLLDPEGL